MKASEFDFALPPERIAHEPLPRRERSRLMVLDRDTGRIEHARFASIGRWLAPGDLLVVNDARVIPARLHGRKPTGGRTELLLLRAEDSGPAGTWRALVRGAGRLAPGAEIVAGPGLTARFERRDGEAWVVRLVAADGDLDRALARAGSMPLPPYIRRPDPDTPAGRAWGRRDRRRYQTVYAVRPGAVAAPTAGLHFTRALLGRLEASGIGHVRVTLHVGPGTFRPLRAEHVEDHVLDPERFEIGAAAADAIARTREGGGRVVAVGTTVVRTLESSAARDGRVRAASGWCDLFVRPGHRFRAVDALVTNFHLPRSSLIVLVAAFAGRGRVLEAYRIAVAAGYRFYSYGDAMLVRSA